MIEIEIDGKKIAVEKGTSIIEAAEALGIHIPRFCYHKKLSIAANCRMCLVEVENSPKPLPACATPVADEMKVSTASNLAIEAQRDVLQFLLVNHPLDCPVCDQGGVCELQDLSMGFGQSYSYFNQPKIAFHSDDIGSLVETEMTRCINCTRCVRFGEEIAGIRELGVIGRGGHAEIGTYVKHFLTSELSGNITDICPVGALTTKPNRYQYRGWEVFETPAISPHDCVGANLFVHARSMDDLPTRVVHGIVPRENEAINEVWISDRDRFGFLGLQHEQRLLSPQQKVDGKWETVSWERALQGISKRLGDLIENQSGSQIAALSSSSATVEEQFLLQQWLRAMGSHHIDHRLHQVDFSDDLSVPVQPTMAVGFDAIPALKTIVLIGSDVRTEQPLLSLRIRQASLAGAQVMAINPVDYVNRFELSDQAISGNWLHELAGVVKVVAKRKRKALPVLADVEVSDSAQAIAQKLLAEPGAALMLGAVAAMHPNAALCRQLAAQLAEWTESTLSFLTPGANAAGASLVGAVPHRLPGGESVADAGKNARQLLVDEPVDAYILMNVEPEYDSVFAQAAVKTLKQATCVVCLSCFTSDAMLEYADFILPIAPFTEQRGTYVNASGTWQTTYPASQPHGEAKPAWKVLRVLANFMQLDGFDYPTVESVLEAAKAAVGDGEALTSYPLQDWPEMPAPLAGLHRLGHWSLYSSDAMVRRAEALQAVEHDISTSARMNRVTAEDCGCAQAKTVRVQQGEQSLIVPLVIDDRIADQQVVLPAGLPITAGFGEATAPIRVQQEEA